jgi:diguanylate cyclase (GGDEF)-like protein/PAS domain S-box-containing protein
MLNKQKIEQDLLELHEDIVILTDGKRIKDCNSAFLDFFGINSLKEFLKQNNCVCEKFLKNDKQEFIYLEKNGNEWNKVVEERKLNYKAAMLNKNGEERYFFLKAKRNKETNKTLIVLVDITELFLDNEGYVKQQDTQIHALKNHLEMIDNNVIISITDPKGKITYASEKFASMSGYSIKELLGSSHNIVRHPDTPKETFKEMWETIKTGKLWRGEIKNKRKDGSFYWVSATIIPNVSQNGDVVSYTAIRQDITSIKTLELDNELDELTQIGNRKCYNNNFEKILLDYRKNPKSNSFGLLVADIDSFKLYNDTYGHGEGDEVIKKVAYQIRKIFRKDDIVARYGGEEFVVLVKNINEKIIKQKMNEINETIRSLKIEHKNNNSFGIVTISVGGLLIKEQNIEDNEFFNNVNLKKELFNLADKSLYEVKQNGRNGNLLKII